ncbi:MAG TPA: DNA topoisomerase I [Candidatus Nitrosocosmicus sp.]
MYSSISVSSDDNYNTSDNGNSEIKWNTLVHNGVCFPPDYELKNLKFKINGETFVLNKHQEEMIYSWAKKKDTHYVLDPVFQENFLNDFKKLLPDNYSNSLTSVKQMDLREYFVLADNEKKEKEKEKEKLKSKTLEERKKILQEKKKEKEKLKNFYGKAIVDGVEVDIANWLVEPPGLFMGRGQHPLRGRWKPRVTPNEVILNLSENTPVPEGNWQNIVHDRTSTWLASWIESLTGKRKYVWLHDSSTIRQNFDKIKYDKAKNLEKYINKIQSEIIKRMSSKDINQKKISTVCYLITKLAMRVGDEKDPDEADTVGASTLRIEHIKFVRSKNDKENIEFNFLGKDSVPWQKTLEINTKEIETLYQNLKLFMKNKEVHDLVFDNINSMKVNTFLRNIDPKNVPGLTAKVFRTFIATKIVKQTLKSPPLEVNTNSSETKKIYIAKYANLQAAITCNHKKGIDPKNPASKVALEKYESSITNKNDQIQQIKDDIRTKNWKTEKQKERLEERLEKLEIQLKLYKETKDYSLGTSLRNYIDPRVFKAWMNYMNLDWKKLYTTTLQRKFLWVENISNKELNAFYPK